MRAARQRISATVEGLFSHGPQPLVSTLDHAGDPGLLGPGSVSWRVLGDPAVFVGGIRALTVQAAHPEVAAGVHDHSAYRDDPLGRLTRTSLYVTETTYGAMPEVKAAVAMVRRAHVPVKGISERDRPYDASAPALAAWVHNALTDSFLAAHQAFGHDRLSPAEADQFVAEQTRIGRLLNADPLPTTALGLRRWLVDHPARSRSRAQEAALDFLARPPLPRHVRGPYHLLFQAAATTIDPALRDQLGVEPPPGAASVGTAIVTALRWAMGYSPAWRVALERSGVPIPDGMFLR